MMMELSAEARARLDAYLDAVEQSLRAAGRSREERRGVVDDLESQVLETAARQAGDGVVDSATVEAMLARMDPPEAYAAAEETGLTNEVRERTARPMEARGHREREQRTNKAYRWRSAMRSAVAIAVILCGTFLIAWPEVSEYMEQRNLVRVASLPNGVPQGVNFVVTEMTSERKFGFWFTGSIAIACGVIGGFVAFAMERRADR